ncbi:MAG: HPF/RaiA family ribosome-associated protein [Mycobacterium sp.]|nr:HPF/RaiA family ribosome-associated protein [Mycobacterium sp.]
MRQKSDLAAVFDVDVTTHGQLPGIEEYARTKIGKLGRYTHQPVLHAHVKLREHGDPAVARPVIAQANLDVDGRPVRAQVEGTTAREAVDRLETRLRQQLERLAEHWEAKRGGTPKAGPYEWRRQSEPSHRPQYFSRPEGERRIIRHKTYSLPTCTVEEAAFEMELLDYEFHLFTEAGTGQDSVLYRSGPTEYRLALVDPQSADKLPPSEMPLSISPQPAPRLTVDQAIERIGLLGVPFLFFVDSDRNRGSVLYHRYDGHYGLIAPAS